MSDIRFHLDESVDPDIASGLRRRGVDVTTSQEQRLLGSDDDLQLKFATAHDRVLVTHDEDFFLLARSVSDHAGIAYCHQQTRSIGEIIAALLLIRECLSTTDMQNHIEFL